MLFLENGIIINCIRINKKEIIGEITYNISNYGYTETISDPSYNKQILVLSSPHVGNVGIIKQDLQNKKIKLNTLIINNYSVSSNFRVKNQLNNFLKNKFQILSNVDTRYLINIVRKIGQQYVCITKKNNILIIIYLRSISFYKVVYD